MAAEAQHIIAVSLNKILASRGRRNGVSLHRNLLVASVLLRAKDAYFASGGRPGQRLVLGTPNGSTVGGDGTSSKESHTRDAVVAENAGSSREEREKSMDTESTLDGNLTESELAACDSTDAEIASCDTIDAEIASCDTTDSELVACDTTNSELAACDTTDAALASCDTTDSELATGDITDSKPTVRDTTDSALHTRDTTASVADTLDQSTIEQCKENIDPGCGESLSASCPRNVKTANQTLTSRADKAMTSPGSPRLQRKRRYTELERAVASIGGQLQGGDSPSSEGCEGLDARGGVVVVKDLPSDASDYALSQKQARLDVGDSYVVSSSGNDVSSVVGAYSCRSSLKAEDYNSLGGCRGSVGSGRGIVGSCATWAAVPV